jgi:hypothetical protein
MRTPVSAEAGAGRTGAPRKRSLYRNPPCSARDRRMARRKSIRRERTTPEYLKEDAAEIMGLQSAGCGASRGLRRRGAAAPLAVVAP